MRTEREENRKEIIRTAAKGIEQFKGELAIFPPTNTPTQGTVSMAHLRNAMNSLIFRSFTVTAF